MGATIKIVGNESQGGFVIINKEDFDDDIHELYVEGKAATPKTIDKMKKDELVEYAKGKEIEIDESANKADILAAIVAAEAPADPE